MAVAPAAQDLSAEHTVEVHLVVVVHAEAVRSLTAEVHSHMAEVLIAVVHAAADSAVAALAAVVPSAEAHTEVVLTVVDIAVADIAVAVAAEWADTDKSEHQLPDFRIRHPRNFAH